MIIGFFKNNNPASFILLPLLAIVLWVLPFIHPVSFIPQQIMPFYGLMGVPMLNFPFLSSILALVLILIGAFLTNYICNSNEIFAKQSFLPALFYVVLMSMNTTTQVLHPVLFSNLFLLLAIAILIDSYRKDIAFSNSFNAGALITISVLFYFPNIMYFPMIGIALIIFRSFNWREWVISFFGALLPLVFLFSYCFWNDKLLSFFEHVQTFFHVVPRSQNQLSWNEYIPLIIGALILLLSFSSILNLSSNSQKSKKSIRLLFWVALFSGGAFVIAPESSIKYLTALVIPFAVFYANYFLTAKKTKGVEFLFLLFLASILFQQVYKFL